MPHIFDQESRRHSLEHAREEYVWDWSWPPGCATLFHLPPSHAYKPELIRQVAGLSLDLVKNHGAQEIEGAKRTTPPPLPKTSDDLLSRFFATAEHLNTGIPRNRPASPEGYVNYFATIPQTPLVVKQRQHPEEADAFFAWQRVGGCNPMSLQRLASLPEDFPLTEAHWQAAIGSGSLAAALDAGKVYGVDFTMLHGVPATKYLGRQKYICGTRGIFAAPDKALRPVAIQIEPGGPVYTPADGTAWAMAKYFFQVADANVHETMEHLGRTHMVMEAVGIAAYRQLHEDHPLMRLVEPHVVGTFSVNASAKSWLIAPNGVIDRVFAARIDVAVSLVRKALDTFVLQDCAPMRTLRARGVDNPTALDFPYRDDVVPIYEAIERFARGYVDLYYPDDATVAADVELQEWVSEVGSPIGGALHGIRPVQNVAGLVEWMTNIIFLGSAQHAAVNFPQFPFYGWGASVAGACWGPPPSGEVTDANLLELMPPWDCLFLQADVVYELAGVYFTRLGQYSFPDPRVAPVVRDFQKALADIDETIAAVDRARFLTYPFLRPSTVPASINI